MPEGTVLRVSPEEKLAIREAHGKTEEEIAKDVEAMKEWLKKQRHLPQELGDDFLEMTLQRNKYSLEKSKSKLDTYFRFRNLTPEFYKDRNLFSEHIQTYMKCVTFVAMPNLLMDRSRLFFCRIENHEPKLFDAINHMKFFFLMADLRMYFDLSDSETFLFDLKQLKFDHVVKLTPPIITKACTVLLKGYSDKIKGLHFINLPSYANSLVLLVQSLFNKKLTARIHVHKNLESLYEYIPKEDLPSDYHGYQKSLSELFVEWKKFIESKNDWTLKQAELKSNEALRIGGSLEEDVFGSIHGSFRTLNVD